VQKHTLGEWETERPFDGKLCPEYFYQKLLKSDNWFSSYGLECWGCFFETQCSFKTNFHIYCNEIYSSEMQNPFGLCCMLENQLFKIFCGIVLGSILFFCFIINYFSFWGIILYDILLI